MIEENARSKQPHTEYNWLPDQSYSFIPFPQVIGDKKAAKASRILLDPNVVESLKNLEIKLGVQIKFIHETRNPFDNIATMTLRRAQADKKGQESRKVSC